MARGDDDGNSGTARFGPFAFDLSTQQLSKSGQPLKIGSRAAALLRLLISRAGETIGRADIEAAVWPGLTVDDVNIRVQVATLRKRLEDQGPSPRYIVSVPGLGYRWIGSRTTSLPDPQETNEPVLLGRGEALDTIESLLSAKAVTSVVGSGGLGKTAMARRLLGRWREAGREAVFVDLSAVESGDRLAPAVLAGLGSASVSEDPVISLIATLEARPVLIVLDNCEHLTGQIADLVAAILSARGSTVLLATSREALGLDAETIFEVEALTVPDTGVTVTTETADRFSAIALFNARALAANPGYRPTDRDLQAVAEICRRLDGLPLALELAAARISDGSAQALLKSIQDRIDVLRNEVSGHHARHQTLTATLDWSYRLLSEDQQALFRRLGVFRSEFDAADALAVAWPAGQSPMDVAGALEQLAAKSMLSRVRRDGPDRFRLLETSRAYALYLSTEAGEETATAARHARNLVNLYDSDDGAWDAADDAVRALSRTRIDDVRAALDWAWSPAGDAQLAVLLTARSAPVWLSLFLFFEYRDRIEIALAGSALGTLDPDVELRLQSTFAVICFSTGGQIPKVLVAAGRALALATEAGSVVDQYRALWALIGGSVFACDYHGMLRYSVRYTEIATEAGDAQQLSVGHRLMARALNYVGRQDEARRYVDLAVAAGSGSGDVFQMDNRIMTLGNLARILWFQGLADQAHRALEEMIAEARSLDHAPSTCLAVAENACTVYLWSGDFEKARSAIALLRTTADRYGFSRWQDWAWRFEEALDLAEQGRPDQAVVRRHWAPPTMFHAFYMGSLHPSMVGPEALARVEQDDEVWCAAEILRGAAEQIMGAGGDADDLDRAEALLVRAIAVARRQTALAFELRAALSLVRLDAQRGQGGVGVQHLREVYGRLTEGFDALDAVRARAVLQGASGAAQPDQASSNP